MAEFLIKARDPADLPSDSEKRDRGWKRGDIVVVFPDGHEWGKEERLPKFVVVKVPGLSVEEGRKYTAPYCSDTGLLGANGKSIERIVAMRKYRLLIDSMPSEKKNGLEKDGILTVSWENVKSYFHNKETGVTE